MSMQHAIEQSAKSYGALIKRAVNDSVFRARLIEQPASVLREEGIRIPEGVKVSVVENSESRLHFVLPAKPTAELTDEQLEDVAGGIDPFFIGAAAIVAVGVLGMAATTAAGLFIITKGFTESPFKK